MRSVIWFYLLLIISIYCTGCFLVDPARSRTSPTSNAFYYSEKRMQTSNYEISRIIDKNINRSESILRKKPKLRYPLTEGISEIRIAITDFSLKIDQFKTSITAAELIKDKNVISDKNRFSKIIEKSFLDSINFEGRELSRFNDYGDIIFSNDQKWSTYIMVDLKYGDDLEILIMTTRDQIIIEYVKTLKASQSAAQMPDKEMNTMIKSIEKDLPLKIMEDWMYTSDSNSWAESAYDQLPYAACMSSLEQHKLDAKISESILINQLISLAGR